MPRGIKVIWPGKNDTDTPDEIEFFQGIDVENLDQIRQFTKVPAEWPRHQGGTFVEYNVETHREPVNSGEVHLVVRYDRAANEHLVEAWGDCIGWGTNTIILRPGEQNGTCHWLHEDDTGSYEVPWKEFNLGANQTRSGASQFRPERKAGFRNMILKCDECRCVLTGETVVQALDAAHLIPAATAENDIPFNGITLRADLHRLFDAGMFSFNPDGRVELPDRDPGLSDVYVRRLRNAYLPEATFRRVKEVLASSEFQNR